MHLSSGRYQTNNVDSILGKILASRGKEDVYLGPGDAAQRQIACLLGFKVVGGGRGEMNS